MLRLVLNRQSSALQRTVSALPRRLVSASPAPPPTPMPAPNPMPPQRTQPPATSSAPHQLSMLAKWTAPRAEHPKLSAAWYGEKALQCVIFAIAGSGSMYLLRPVLPHLGFSSSSILQMTWPEKFVSILIMSPLYSMLLLTVATLFGRYAYFRPFFIRIWSRVPGAGAYLEKKLP